MPSGIAGQALGDFGGMGQSAGGGLQLGGSGRYRVDDVATRGFKLIGELVHFDLARGRGGAALGFLLLRLALRLLDGHHLERLDGIRHVADFIATAEAGQNHAEIS
jgi:hypothetical protein